MQVKKTDLVSLRISVAFSDGSDDGNLSDDRLRIRIGVTDHHPVDG